MHDLSVRGLVGYLYLAYITKDFFGVLVDIDVHVVFACNEPNP